MWRSKYNEPLPGTRFGEWTVLEDYREKNKHMKDKITVQCSCGEIRDVNMTNMLTGRSTSCGHNQYVPDHDEIISRKNNYQNRIGQMFGNYKLTTFERAPGDSNIITYTLTCRNGHEHIFHTMKTPRNLTKQTQFKCWCEVTNPVVRMRKKHNLTLNEVGQRLGRTRERIRQYENALKHQRMIKNKAKKGYSDEQLMKKSTIFQKLACAYNLSNREQDDWINEIIHNKRPDVSQRTITKHNASNDLTMDTSGD